MQKQEVILATFHQIVYHKCVMLKVDNEIMSQFNLPSEDMLWERIIENKGRLFKTYTGLPFSYNIKIGRDGSYTKELWIDRRQHSKSLAWGSIRRAYEKVVELTIEKGGTPVIERPKALGDIRGISYIYGIFYNFGIIEVPEPIKIKMR